MISSLNYPQMVTPSARLFSKGFGNTVTLPKNNAIIMYINVTLFLYVLVIILLNPGLVIRL